ncbi:MAG: L-myo-inositol-1-phosphate synthase [Thermoprotei archaeon]
MSKIRVGLIGVGNAASSFVQGLYYYKNGGTGLWHEKIGPYKVSDIEIVAAFDVDKRKVGMDLSKAIFSEPNTIKKYADVPNLGVEVLMGHVVEPLSSTLKKVILYSDEKPVDIADVMKSNRVDIVLNLLPAGLDRTSKFYAEMSLKANVAFVNATPSNIVNDEEIVSRCRNLGLPVVGDDLLSQLGGTILHKQILNFLEERGILIESSYQLDAGGSVETLNTMNEDVKQLKRTIKTKTVSSAITQEAEIATGTTDYVPFLSDTRISYLWVKGYGYLGSPIILDIKLRTEDGPNAGNVLLDVTRALKIARDRGLTGPVKPICDYGFKNPPQPHPKNVHMAYEEFIKFINQS